MSRKSEESFENQYEYWKDIAVQIDSNGSMEKFVHGKVKAITLNNNGRILEYMPKSDGDSTFLAKLESHDLRSAPIAILPHGVYESGVEKILEVFLSSAEKFIDCGANIGFIPCLP